jgi:transposase
MDRAAYRAAKAHLVARMQAGQSWHEAAASVGLQTSRSSAYRLLRRVRTEGAVALDDQRHGHPTKVRQPVREWLAAFCCAAPEATGRTVQTAILERFGLEVSVSQINRLRAALGVRRQGSGAGEKSAERVAGSAHLV